MAQPRGGIAPAAVWRVFDKARCHLSRVNTLTGISKDICHHIHGVCAGQPFVAKHDRCGALGPSGGWVGAPMHMHLQ